MTTIPDLAVAELDKALQQGEGNSEHSRSIFIAGSISVGKTTAIYNFLEKSETVKETLVLEYSFGRKYNQKQSVEKCICHIWEYGGKLDLLEETMECIPRQRYVTFVIMLDLSKPKKLWLVLEVCFQAIDRLSSGSNKTQMNVLIIGGKYDLFKNFDSDTKKNVAVTIRSLAMIYDAFVVFYSAQDQALSKRLKQIFHLFGFGSGSFPKDKYVSISKPLCIPRGSDSWESIGVEKCNIDAVKLRHLTLFPTELDDFVQPATKKPDTHSEPILESLKKKKYDEMLDVVDLQTSEYIKMYS